MVRVQKKNPVASKHPASQVAPASASAHASKAGSSLEDVKRMMVNPGAHPPARVPSDAPYTGAVRTFTRTFDLAATAADDPFNLILRPAISETLRMSGAVAPILSNNYFFSTWNSASVTNTTYTAGGTWHMLEGPLRIFADTANKPGVYTELDSVSDPVVGAYWEINGSGSTDMYVGALGGCSKLKVFARIAGSWTDQGDASVTDVVTVNAGGVFDAIALGVFLPTQTHGITVNFERAGTATANPTFLATGHHDLFSTDAVTLSKVSTYRVVAMSALVTFSGNVVDNGGVIAAARTRRGFNWSANDPYQSLTKLQDHSYRGALRDGAYAWWLPYNLDEIRHKGMLDTRESTELRIAGRFDDAAGSVQVVLSMSVEFYSPLQIFEHEVGPPMSDAYDKMLHMLDTYPAATCNPDHSRLLNSIVKKAHAVGKAALHFAMDNPQIIMSILAAV